LVFGGERWPQIASVARVELTSSTEGAGAATRVPSKAGACATLKCAHPRGTTVAVRDLFFNIPARRKFLRSEATETFHSDKSCYPLRTRASGNRFQFYEQWREVLRAAPAQNLRERAYQILAPSFLDNLLEVNGGQPQVAPDYRLRVGAERPAHQRAIRNTFCQSKIVAIV